MFGVGIIRGVVRSRRTFIGVIEGVSMSRFMNGDLSMSWHVIRAGTVNKGVIGRVIMSRVLGIVGRVIGVGVVN